MKKAAMLIMGMFVLTVCFSLVSCQKKETPKETESVTQLGGYGEEKAPETGEEKAPETGEEKAPEADEEKAPEADEEKAPEAGEEKAPETGGY
jgi:type IV secretory pathway VirB10-like protein